MSKETSDDVGKIVRFSITMNKDVLDAIDKERGSIERSTFIEFYMRSSLKLLPSKKIQELIKLGETIKNV